MYVKKRNTNQLMTANYPLGKHLGLRKVFKGDLLESVLTRKY